MDKEQKKIVMMRKIGLFSIAVLAIVAIGIWWGYTQTSDDTMEVVKPAAIPVQVTKATISPISNQVTAVGTLKAQQQINVAPQIDGKIMSILYQPGRFVKKGTVLFQLDDRIYAAQLRSAESALHFAKMNYERAQKLARIGAESRQMLDKSLTNYQQAAAAVNSNKTYLSQAQIRAPFSGYMGAQNVSVGDYVRKGQTLTTLTDRSVLLVNYSLSERYILKLQLGQSVTVILPNSDHKDFTGTVSYISPTVNVSTHSINLQATVQNKDNLLAPGLFVRIRQTLGMNKNAVVVPESAIVSTITGPIVFLIKKNKADRVPVKIGQMLNDKVEITKGVSAGDVVVVAGQQQLIQGSHVRIVDETE